VHELHVWRLDQTKAVASAHLVVSDPDVAAFMARARTVGECLHAYGIHSATLQPELLLAGAVAEGTSTGAAAAAAGGGDAGDAAPGCQILCGKGMCGHLMCCGEPVQV
jgi:zinc transporter 1